MRSIARLLVLVAMLFSAQSGTAQDTGYRDWYRRAETSYNSNNPTGYTDSMAVSFYGRVIAAREPQAPYDSLVSDSYLKTGIIRMAGSQFRQAIRYFLHNLEPHVSGSKGSPAILFQSLLYAGSCYYEVYELDSALYFYRLAEDTFERHSSLPGTERLFNKMGVLYYEFGDYRRSILYFTKALAMVEATANGNRLLSVNYRNNIASAWLKLGQFRKAIEMFKQLLSFGEYHSELSYNIGSAFLDAGKPREAIDWMRHSALRSQACYNNMAKCWLKLGRPDSAEYYLRVGRKNRKTTDDGISFKLMGDVRLARGNAAGALTCYQRALIRICPDFNDTAIAHNPSDFRGIRESFILFDLLCAKAGTLRGLGERRQDFRTLALAFSTYLTAIRLAQHVQRLYVSDDARQFLAGKADSAYQEAILLGYRLFLIARDSSFLQRIFENIESGKASVLQARLGDPGPAALRGDLHRLAKQLQARRVEAARLELAAGISDGNEKPGIRDRLRELEIDISSLQDRLERSPEYLSKRFATSAFSVSQLQTALPRDAALLSYYYAKDTLFCFYITQQQYGLIRTTWDSGDASAIALLRRELNEGAAGDRQAMDEAVHRLSLRLIAPVYRQIKDKQRLVIAPYNELNYLPFELLRPPGSRLPLVYGFAVSYSYSANMLSFRPDAKVPEYRVLALAPFTEPAGDLAALPASASEVKDFPGQVLVGRNATFRQLIRHIGEYPVVHFATHAMANDEDPALSYIALRADSDDKGQLAAVEQLYLQSICQLDMSGSHLVFLSACETGKGPLVRGEGVISIARAFQYAGCRSVITALWKADDAASAYLARRTHKYLKKGFACDKALQQAKLDYLEDANIDARFKEPAYWAHFILIGDFAPVVERPLSLWPWLVLSGIAMIGLIGLSIKKSRALRSTRRAGRITAEAEPSRH